MLLMLCLALFLLLCLGILFSGRLIFQPQSHELPVRDGVKLLEVEPGISIAVKYRKVPGSSYTILYSHGNAEDLYDIAPVLDDYVHHGYSVAAYDYEGYGSSQGSPSESNCYRDIERFYDYLVKEKNIAPESIIIYGRSVGGGPSCYLAEKRKAAALILESPFMTAFRVMLPFSLPGDAFPNISRIANTSIPVLIYHGTLDQVINVSHGRTLADVCAPRARYVEISDAGHNDLIFRAGDRYWNELKIFIDSLPSRPGNL